MSIEVRPLGVNCNLQCQYCYQTPQRDAANLAGRYDMDAMKRALQEEGGAFSIFGGEPLLVPEKDLEDLWAWGLAKYGSNGIQTNGALINDEHIRLFKRYKVQVGISIDGPGDLNDVRWNGTLERTREATARTEASIERLCREGLAPSIILTLHRNNATADKLPLLFDWVHYLEAKGVRWMRLHLLEIDVPGTREKYALSGAENTAALIGFLELQRTLPKLRFDLFSDMRRMLLGDDRKTTCIWNGCDPYTTRAVRGVEGHGQRSNCGRTNKDGIDFIKGEAAGFERYLALYATPQEYGGCLGCRFFLMCKGNCPGTGMQSDWRNRSEHCETWTAVYKRLEADLIREGLHPISRSEKLIDYERAFLDAWESGRQISLSELCPRSSRSTR